MAEGLARKKLGGQAIVESAGTNAKDGCRASDKAIKVMKKLFEIDISSHRSRKVEMKDDRVNDFDYIVAMDDTVASCLRCAYPSISAKLIPWDIPDPLGKGISDYERCARKICKRVESFLASTHMPVE
jgi:protein-tyrosine-phosphatase